jgi:hypothetical protein
MRIHVLPLVGLAALTLGCGGGQTGDLSGRNEDDGQEAAGNGCIERRQKLDSLDQVTEFGSPEQVLAYAERSFDAPLTWKPPRAGASWSAGPESGESSIHIEVTRGESAYLLSYEPEESQGGEGIAVGRLCPESLLGALTESVDTLLRSSGSGLATFNVGLDLEELGGSLALEYSSANAKVVQLGLNATLMAEGTTGNLAGLEQVELGDVTSAGPALLAVWPAAPACAPGDDGSSDGTGLSVAGDQAALGITGDAAAELISSMTPVSVQWLDGASTELTLTTSLLGAGCLRKSNSPIPGDPSGTVTYPALFALESADGRLLGEYTGSLVTFPEGDGHAVTAQAHRALTLEEVAQSGFASAQVPAGVERLMLQFEARRAGVVKSGAVRLTGLTDPPCATDPQPSQPSTPGMGASSPGCAGSTITPIEAAAWGDL